MILCSGAFDGIHVGHVRYLAAAAQCREADDEVLVVAVAPDAYIAQHKAHAPQWNTTARLTTVRALDMVDAAIVHGPESVANIIRDYRPRLFVKGVDWQGCLPEDVQAACTEVGTVIGYVDSQIGQHSSDAA